MAAPTLDLDLERKRFKDLLDKGDFDSALALLRQIIAAKPEDLAYRRFGASRLWSVGRRLQSVEILDEHLKAGPANAETCTNSAAMHLELAEDGPNITHSSTMVSASPSRDPEADKAWIKRQLIEAERMARLACKSAPNKAAGYRALLNALTQLENWKEARKAVDQVPPELAKDEPLALRMASILLKTGEAKSANALIAPLLIEHPREIRLLKRQEEILKALGNEPAAKEVGNRARFYGFLLEDTSIIEFSSAAYGRMETLSGPIGSDADRKKVRATINSLAKQSSIESDEMLAAFAWRHTHDELEDAAFDALERRGKPAHAILIRLARQAQSTCTAGHALRILGDQKAEGSFAVMAYWLPRDVRPYWAMHVPFAMSALNDSRAVDPLLDMLENAKVPIGNDDINMDAALLSLKQEAAIALGELGAESARAALKRAVVIEDLNEAANMGLCLLDLSESACKPLSKDLATRGEHGQAAIGIMNMCLKRMPRLNAKRMLEYFPDESKSDKR